MRQSCRERKQRERFDPSAGLGEKLTVAVGMKRGVRRGEEEVENTPKRARRRTREEEASKGGKEEEEAGEGWKEEDNLVERSDTGGEGVMELEEGGALEPVGLSEEGCWSHLKALCETLPGRRRQIEQLLTLCGEVSWWIGPRPVLTEPSLPPARLRSLPQPLRLRSHGYREDTRLADCPGHPPGGPAV